MHDRPRIPRLKICCIASQAEARLALEAGAEALGFVSAMPSGPGVISEILIGEIIASLPEETPSLLLTSRTRAEEIAGQARRCRCAGVQLCAPVTRATLSELRARLPELLLIPVIHVGGEMSPPDTERRAPPGGARMPASLAEARALAPLADALLLDSGVREGPRRQLGGTGRTHDWQLSRRLREMLTCPVILAGGLKAGNVAEAVATVNPYGVDVCSGVRTAGKLDPSKLAAFVKAVRGALE